MNRVERAGLQPWGMLHAAGAGQWRAAISLRRGAATLPLVIVVATLLRGWLLASNHPLHHDEALYGYWAQLIASGRDPFLLTAWVDKPPLVIYLAAVSLRLFGVSEWALRLPGMIASLATIVCVYGLSRRLYDARTAFLASVLLALSPFAILFAPTIFTDPWLTLWLTAAAWAAVSRRDFVAGIAVGLAVASKQQGVLVAALVIALLVGEAVASAQRPARVLLPILGRLGPALLGFALVFAPLTWWDSLRWSNRPSFWDRSLTTYGGLGLAPLSTWPDRAADWGRIFGYLFGAAGLTVVMLGLALAAAFHDRRRVTIRVMAAFLLGYLALHFLATFQPWDRYLLPILPLLCLLAARGVDLWHHGRLTPRLKPARRAVGIGLVLLLSWAAWLGVTARLPVGSDHGAYAGLDRIAAFLRSQEPDAIIYHRWLGWHYDFYLFDAPQERRWWGAAWKLADDAGRTQQETPARTQWLVLPGWRDVAAGDVRLALASRGLGLIEAMRVYRSDGSRAFTVYRIVPEVVHRG